jgi:hypothetical protein
MRAFPLIYGFHQLVAGDGFVAGVEIQGRALLARDGEEGAWWLYGVEPGGIAEPGATEMEAYQNFRDSLREVLCDSAALATRGFESLQADVKALAGQKNGVWEQEWEAARQAIRSGQLQPEGEVLATLPRHTSKVSCRTSVVLLTGQGRDITPEDNCAEEVLKTAA